MKEPKIEDYPTWLRDLIKEPLYRSISNQDRNCLEELEYIYNNRKMYSIYKVVVILAVETIKLRFEMWEIHKKLKRLNKEDH